MRWIWKKYSELTTDELYEIIRLRLEVFVVEQNCPYQDLDGKDAMAWHLLGYQDVKLVAYARLLPPGGRYPDNYSIGRVVNSPIVRRQGVGRALMLKMMDEMKKRFGAHPIRISAQYYLKNFYESLGFKKVSEIYLEDNIDHIEMLRPAT